jgi:hypothetical protein
VTDAAADVLRAALKTDEVECFGAPHDSHRLADAEFFTEHCEHGHSLSFGSDNDKGWCAFFRTNAETSWPVVPS